MSTQTFQKGDRVVIGDAADYSGSDGIIVDYRSNLGTVHDGTPDSDGDIKVVPDGLDPAFDDWVYVLPQHLTLEAEAKAAAATTFPLATIRRALSDLGYFVAAPGDDADPANSDDWDLISTYALGLAERARLEEGR